MHKYSIDLSAINNKHLSLSYTTCITCSAAVAWTMDRNIEFDWITCCIQLILTHSTNQKNILIGTLVMVTQINHSITVHQSFAAKERSLATFNFEILNQDKTIVQGAWQCYIEPKSNHTFTRTDSSLAQCQLKHEQNLNLCLNKRGPKRRAPKGIMDVTLSSWEWVMLRGSSCLTLDVDYKYTYTTCPISSLFSRYWSSQLFYQVWLYNKFKIENQ